MSNVSARLLLAQLRGRGVELSAAGGRVSCAPASAVDAELRERIGRLEAPLLALLGGAPGAKILETPEGGGEKTEERSVPPPSFSSCSTPPARFLEIAPINPDLGGDRTYPCYCCGSREFWALTHVRRWTCVRCHPPEARPASELIWLRLPSATTDSAAAQRVDVPAERRAAERHDERTAKITKTATAPFARDCGTCTHCGTPRVRRGKVLQCTACGLLASLRPTPEDEQRGQKHLLTWTVETAERRAEFNERVGVRAGDGEITDEIKLAAARDIWRRTLFGGDASEAVYD
jgi:hypothetical protein